MSQLSASRLKAEVRCLSVAADIGHTGIVASTEGVVSQRYADHRPYANPPVRLTDLRGPGAGVLDLPITIDWGPKRAYDLGGDADRRIAYERVLREAATTEDLERFLNATVLIAVWRRLFLPRRIRTMWEERFPELSTAA